MATAIKSNDFRWFFLRGLLGGALGGLLWTAVAVLTAMAFSQTAWQWLLLGYVVNGLPMGLITGALVATVIRLINRRRAAGLSVATRILYGTMTGMLVWSLSFWLTSNHDYVPTPWHTDFLWIVFFGLALGGSAGLLVGNQRSLKNVPDKIVSGIL